jgi:hypothetical protein
MADKKIANELPTDYQLIGIATSLKEYKLCYHINQLLNADFQKLPDLVFESKDRTRQVQFSVFKSGGEADRVQYMVFGNKNLNEVLLTEISNFDFILQIHGKLEPEEIKAVVDGIKEFPEIVLTAEIPLKKIKSKERLVYREEKPPQKTISPKRFK